MKYIRSLLPGLQQPREIDPPWVADNHRAQSEVLNSQTLPCAQLC